LWIAAGDVQVRVADPVSSPGKYPLSKRLLDLAVAVPALILSSPAILVVGIMVATRLGRPVLFRQERPGLNAKPFTILKFRTMLDSRSPDGRLLPDEDRLPRFGRWLRSTSLDELPELWNIVRGDMSLVGPRPLLMTYLSRYSPAQARRHEVPPGLTGWAQINGRNAIDWDSKLAMDVWYVDHWSLWLDLKILAATLLTVIRRHGIAAEGSATIPEFTGSNGEHNQSDLNSANDR
jgi:lipopolysaccharide/colanic/teichoic acid biosynthesis glycosyltransferase